MTHIFSWYHSPPGITLPLSILLDPLDPFLFLRVVVVGVEILYNTPVAVVFLGSGPSIIHFLSRVAHIDVSYHLVDGIGDRRIGLDSPGIDAGRCPTSLFYSTYTHDPIIPHHCLRITFLFTKLINLNW